PVLERPARHELDGEVAPALGLPGLEHRDEVPIANLGGRAGLLLEALPEDRILDQLEAHHLERDFFAVALADGAADEAPPPISHAARRYASRYGPRVSPGWSSRPGNSRRNDIAGQGYCPSAPGGNPAIGVGSPGSHACASPSSRTSTATCSRSRPSSPSSTRA